MKSATELNWCDSHVADTEPFGNWQAIINRNLTFYHRASELLAKHASRAAEFNNRLLIAPVERRFRVLGDPVVRTALNDLLAAQKKGLEISGRKTLDVLDEAAPFLDAESNLTPMEAGGRSFRVRLAPQEAVVWRSERGTKDVLGNEFQELFQREIATSISSRPAVLRQPTESMEATLQSAAELLDELLPNSSRSMLAHVQLICIVDVSDRAKWNNKLRTDLCQSVSTHAVPGTVFLSPSVLRSPYHAAEALFHEAGHKKLSDLVFTRSIFRAGYTEHTSPTIPALWNRSLSWNSADWSIDRALFAFHVYVHLGLFFSTLEARLDEVSIKFGSLDGMNPTVSARGAYNRARYLGREIQRYAEESLGTDGKACVKWLMDVLHKLDPNPTVEKPDIHLLMDRYDRETRDITALLTMLPPQAFAESQAKPMEDQSVHTTLKHFVSSEVVNAGRVLALIGASDDPGFQAVHSIQRTPGTLSQQEVVGTIRSVRAFVSRALRDLPEAMYNRQDDVQMRTVIDTVNNSAHFTDKLISYGRQRRRDSREQIVS